MILLLAGDKYHRKFIVMDNMVEPWKHPSNPTGVVEGIPSLTKALELIQGAIEDAYNRTQVNRYTIQLFPATYDDC